ncbi:DUF262 domain-containing protein [Flavobacterium sp. 25HG05S-40]|uniref:DUF262 domain-containing protein n=1 Tax=Flavobacterium sp. 25HG05S-40 TaxID=3458682 RepID=UPI0040442A08
MTDKNLKNLEEKQLFEDNSNELPPSDIVAFNEQRSCADLLRLYQSGQIEIQPDFQRDIVWSKPDQTRFIDSLTKQLPIPSMCISLDYKTDKRIVIDGLQRMNSIITFLSDDEWKLSELEDIDEKLSGKTVHTIKTKSKDIYERVQNVMIPVTVIRCDFSKPLHSEYLFTIFHRLNSGGVKLNNQEIRNCIYNGSFNTLLKSLAKATETKKLFGLKTRFANEEIILRFFAFNDRLTSYNGKLSKFLNDYMFENRDMDDTTQKIKNELYSQTATLIYEKIFDKASATSLGKTFLEGLLYGISQNLGKLQAETPEKVKQLYEKFKGLPEFSVQSLKEGLSAKDKVVDRLDASKKCFAQ